jgi:hypothetical protein
LWRHILPSTFPPLIVQATYICASAILIEAGLSFLGAGTPPEITWGNPSIASTPGHFGMGSRDLLRALDAQGVQTRPLWQPAHLSPAHRAPYVRRAWRRRFWK